MNHSFISTHDQCLNDWEQAVFTGEAGALTQYPSDDYQGFFGYKGMKNMEATIHEE